jgi:hypothetical protein
MPAIIGRYLTIALFVSKPGTPDVAAVFAASPGVPLYIINQ